MTKILTISDLRKSTSKILENAGHGDEATYITQHGRPTAVLLGYEAYENLLEQIDDLIDLVSLREGQAEPTRSFEAFLEDTEG